MLNKSRYNRGWGLHGFTGQHLKKFEYGESNFSCNLFIKVKLSYILDLLQVKKIQSFFGFNFDD